ncbi:MAG: RibD family protein [Proteobacteria bacterium]|nr:RibD family protein [Pseudomonadota bacterium]
MSRRPVSPEAAGLLDLYAPLAARLAAGPFVVAHLAQTLDGRIATRGGASRWISGAADQVHTHRLRALCDAVVVGAGTVALDDPQLNVREASGPNPVRVVLDPDRRLGGRFRVFTDGAAPTLLVCAEDRAPPRPARSAGAVEAIGVPRAGDGLDLRALLTELRRRGLAGVFVEGGGVTVSRFLRQGLLDRLQIAVAPVILGSGRPGIALPEVRSLAEGRRLAVRHVRLGADMLFDCALAPGGEP